MARQVHVIINPGSGQPQPILHTLNQVFRARDTDWDITLTKKSGDAERFARRAAESGVDVVAAYGGDGTVMEVARGLIGTPVPMAIFPGGTANLMSVELGIPKKLDLAAAIAADPESPVRMVDMGSVGDSLFLLRVGAGFAAQKVIQADRKLKDRWGLLAYSIGAVKALKVTHKANYRITLDGMVVEVVSPVCQVYNAGNMGMASVKPVKNIDVSDGLLDVVALRESATLAILAGGTDLAASSPDQLFYHWQAKQITIEADPPQPVQVDGEVGWNTPVNVQIQPGAIRILTSAPA